MEISRFAVTLVAGTALGAAVTAVAADPKGGNPKVDPADCAGFTPQDAAPFLGVPAAQVARSVRKIHATLYACSFTVGRAAPGVAFSIEIAASAKKAADEMERYRDNLSTAGDTAPWKGKLPKGAYSDIMGVGDEGVWTDINGALTVRKGNVTIQVTMPKGKLEQVRLAEAVVKKL